jgi:hypothetical protein
VSAALVSGTSPLDALVVVPFTSTTRRVRSTSPRCRLAHSEGLKPLAAANLTAAAPRVSSSSVIASSQRQARRRSVRGLLPRGRVVPRLRGLQEPRYGVRPVHHELLRRFDGERLRSAEHPGRLTNPHHSSHPALQQRPRLTQRGRLPFLNPRVHLRDAANRRPESLGGCASALCLGARISLPAGRRSLRRTRYSPTSVRNRRRRA